ncbi:hypothetical protein BRD56_00860 [Thermoplasmatales archaeon SW_10_69_26]|nr:MAG: hypothetical protein BRD56_00860 [Thermoplasmatales archaeon SW_10_69_26]
MVVRDRAWVVAGRLAVLRVVADELDRVLVAGVVDLDPLARIEGDLDRHAREGDVVVIHQASLERVVDLGRRREAEPLHHGLHRLGAGKDDGLDALLGAVVGSLPVHRVDGAIARVEPHVGRAALGGHLDDDVDGQLAGPRGGQVDRTRRVARDAAAQHASLLGLVGPVLADVVDDGLLEPGVGHDVEGLALVGGPARGLARGRGRSLGRGVVGASGLGLVAGRRRGARWNCRRRGSR